VKRAPAGADALADEVALQAALASVGAVSAPIVFAFTSWDGYAAAHASYEVASSLGAKGGANAVASALVTGAPAALDTATDPAAAAGFHVEAEVVRRSDLTTVMLVALTPAELIDGPSGFLCKDIADGSALAQAADSTGTQCDRFASEGFAALDILWTVDNSTSMNQEQGAVAAAGAAVRSKLENAAVDFRIAAVTSAFYQPGGGAGCTNQACGDNILNQCRSFTTDLDRVTRWFSDGITEGFGSGNDLGTSCNQSNEEIVRGAQLILTDPPAGTFSFMPQQPNDTADEFHLRANTNLLVAMLGDADDLFAPNNAAAAAQIDTYEAFFRALPVQSVTMGGILCPEDQTCGEGQRNPRVARGLVNRFGGIIGSLADEASIGPTVEAIIDSALTQVSPYVLAEAPITSTVKVAMDAGSTVDPSCPTADVPRSRIDGFDVDARTRNVAFFGACRPDPNQPGALIAISYRTWIDQSPDADPEVPPCTVCSTCTGIERCDLDACACVCDGELSCRTGFAWDDALCGCVCDAAQLACDATHEADPDLCACTCKEDCGGCASDYVCNESTCVCEPDVLIGG
jgi:hypothetical protein